MRLPKFLHCLPAWLTLLLTLILVVAIGWADHVTTWDWSFFAPYAVPIVVVTWTFGWRSGFACALLCTTTYWLANIGKNPFKTDWGFGLAVFSRGFYFLILAMAVAMFRAKSESDRARISDLEKMQGLELQVLRTSEREQQRIGRDLHDGLAPHLSAVGYATKFLADDLRKRHLPETAKAEQIHQMVSEAVVLTRNLARGLFPIRPDGEGLAIALDDLASTTSSLTGVQVSFHESGQAEMNDAETVQHLHRIAQEAVSNAIKHGEAKQISIILDKGQAVWRLTVADDGKGMQTDSASVTGIGLLSMRYRARALDGELKIDSRQGEGTIVSCEVPSRESLPPHSRS